MLLCIDAGNTNIVIGIFQDDILRNHWRIRTEREMTSDEFTVLISNLFISAKLEIQSIRDVIISCVVPPLLSSLKEFCLLHFNHEPMIVGPDTNTGLPIKYDNPKEVGADRIVNAVAAY
ncbi:MAG TPA: type III pantothenate kinase, partial [Desulfobacteraceae bacterium]|nr:type III pantothenate kinase [Desulfobacteraceae bacterium]